MSTPQESGEAHGRGQVGSVEIVDESISVDRGPLPYLRKAESRGLQGLPQTALGSVEELSHGLTPMGP